MIAFSFRSIVLWSFWLFLSRLLAHGYQIPLTTSHRRQFLASCGTWIGTTTTGVVGIVAAGGMVGHPAKAHAVAEVAVLKSKGCYQGQGEACDELAGDNALIKSLQEKSAMNRSRNEREGKKAERERQDF
jgi:hypothetical protein